MILVYHKERFVFGKFLFIISILNIRILKLYANLNLHVA